MKKGISILIVAAFCICGCTKEKNSADRSDASDMFSRICRLTEDYTSRMETTADSVSWATLSAEYEEKLDKISFSYPPDTDLLLTEGQNDTIHTLMQAYVKARSSRIEGILHPKADIDTVPQADSSVVTDVAPESVGN